ncbi:MAG: EAL domain-containing protein [Chloroflexi bacterium]|nr:EAL domain-containing protein [Chloroflexota bacterium]
MTDRGAWAAPGGASRRLGDALVSPHGIAALTFVTLLAWMLLSDRAVNAIPDPGIAAGVRPIKDIVFAGAASLLLVVLIRQDRRGISGELRARELVRQRTRHLSGIIRERAFEIVFQPIVELETGRPVGYEALTRFDDGIAPSVRFADAVELELGVELEAACIEAAMRASDRLPAEAWLSLNASASMLTSPRLARLLRRVERRPVVLELTEHEPVADYCAMRSVLESFGDAVRLAVDDTGAGFASLRHLAELRPAIVKLDRDLIHGLENDPTRQAIVAGLQRYAEGSASVLIAEGVETVAERDVLLRIGLTLGQGYLLGRPEPIEARST